MSITGAMQTAISGMNGQSAAIGFISDNVANASTVGYKKVESRFQTLVTQSSAQANTHSSGGVLNQPFFANNAPGPISRVSSTTSIAISGNGFIPVSKQVGTDPSTGLPTFEQTNYYTRVGDFNQNSEGFLINSSGYYLQGWAVDPVTGEVDTSSTSEVRVSTCWTRRSPPIWSNTRQTCRTMPGMPAATCRRPCRPVRSRSLTRWAMPARST